jgi:hypothetical protein
MIIPANAAAMHRRWNGGAGSPSERVSGQQFPAIRENSEFGRKKSLQMAAKAAFL